MKFVIPYETKFGKGMDAQFRELKNKLNELRVDFHDIDLLGSRLLVVGEEWETLKKFEIELDDDGNMIVEEV